MFNLSLFKSHLRVKLPPRYLSLIYCCFLNVHIHIFPEQIKVQVKIEGREVLHKSITLYKGETIFNEKFNFKLEFCGSAKGCSSFLCEFCDVAISIG